MEERSRPTARAADASVRWHAPGQKHGGYLHPTDTYALFRIPCGLAALLDLIEEGGPGWVFPRRAKPCPGGLLRRRRRPGLLGDLDLDDFTPAHELGDGLARQANGVGPRRGFDPTRREGRNGYLDPALGCLGENEGVLHRLHSSVCSNGRLYKTRMTPVMPPARRAHIHDVSPPGPS